MRPGRVGIEPDVVCGTSIGALVGDAYVCAVGSTRSRPGRGS
jgi:predicted acylesterase/phospholipase RssA